MTIEFSCSCGQAIAVPSQMGGKKGKCPRCGQVLDVPVSSAASPAPAEPPPFAAAPAPAAAPASPAAAPVSAGGDKACPMCGESIKAAAIKCRFCGEMLVASAPLPRPAPALARSNGASGALPQEARDAANLALGLGLVGFIMCPLASPFAVWKAGEAREIARLAGCESPGEATAGLVLGWLGVIFMLLSLAAVVVVIALSMP